MHINATRNNCSMNSNYEIKLEKKHFYNFEDCGAKFKTKTWKSLRDYFLPSKAAIKLEGGDGDGKGGLLPFPSVTPPPVSRVLACVHIICADPHWFLLFYGNRSEFL